MSASLDALVPELQPYARELVRIASVAGVMPRVTSTRRSHFEQSRLWISWKSGRSRYPAAFPGTSAHEYGEAFDVVVTPYEALEDMGQVWESWGGTWGGARDPIHFELPGATAQHRGEPFYTLAEAADFVLGFAPYIGEVELMAELLKLGYPRSEILDFLSGPFAHLARR